MDDIFFKPQTKNVDLNLAGDMDQFKRDLQEYGLNNAIISSGRRGTDKTRDILSSRKKREGLDLYPPEAQQTLDRILLRGESPDNIQFPSLTKSNPTHPAYKKGQNWRSKSQALLKDKIQSDKMQEVIDRISRIRKDFAGFQSPHIQGQKVDMSSADYGEEELKRIQSFLNKKGYKTLYESEAGQKGVLDIKLKELKKVLEKAGIDTEGIEERSFMKNEDINMMEEIENLKNSSFNDIADPKEQELNAISLEDTPEDLSESFTTAAEQGVPLVSSANPQVVEGPLQKYLKMKNQPQSAASRLEKAQKDQRMNLGSLAFLRGAQGNSAGAHKLLETLANSPVSNLKDIMQAEKQEKSTKGDKAGAKLYRNLLKHQQPNLEISEDVPVSYLQKLLELKAKGSKKSGSSLFQQSQYMTTSGDPVHFNKGSGIYLNSLNGQKIEDPGSLIRNYVKTITDPKTGEIIEVRPGVGVVGSLALEDTKTKASKDQEPIDFTFEMLNPNQRKELKSIETQYMKDVEDSREFGDILANIGELVDADISAAIPAIKRQLARSVGKEVGVMTDKDVEAFSGDQSFLGALERFTKLQATGRMTERDKDQFRGLIKIATVNLEKAMNIRGNYHSRRLKQRIPHATDDSLRSLLSLEASKPIILQEQSNKVRVTMGNGKSLRINKDKVDVFMQKFPDAKVSQ
ncbi:MAG: hypothetical protein COB41_00450 [Proteobacteria bacterium]|nr:MAG: hypothetical protein COB41_00450 [Pseudomonadota bacterium]